jgi:hypothetical protein
MPQEETDMPQEETDKPQEETDTQEDKMRAYRMERYKKRFQDISPEGGAELEDLEEEGDLDPKGELKITRDGTLLGGMVVVVVTHGMRHVLHGMRHW